MAMRGPLRAEMSRYSKRSRHSIDGSVAGVPAPHGAASYIGMAADSQVGQASPHFDLYDPFIPMYDWAQPNYRPPDPWFVGLHVPSPSPERIAGPEPEAQFIFTELARQHIEISQAVTSVKDDAANEVLLDLDSWGPAPKLGMGHPWFGDDQVPQDMVDAAFRAAVPEEAVPPVPDPAMEPDPLSAMTGPDPLQLGQGLEALVQEAMLQQNPNEFQSDFFAQQQMMHEEEMEQLLNPFAMPGFGPG
jgi:hypothetical protein